MSGTGQLPELESLRSQLAEVARELAERDRTLQAQTTQRDRELQDLREQAGLLRAIIEGTAAETSDDFLASLVNHLTSTLRVQYAIIGEVTRERPQTIRTIAVSAGGITGTNFEYPLAQTPCETALTQTVACFDHHVQDAFPRFTRLRDMGVDSYCGVPIRTKDGTVIGLIAVLDTKRLQHSDWLPSLLAVFATRAGAELLRQRAEQAQREAERRLRFTQFAMDRAVDGVLWADDSGRFVYANEAVCRSLGYAQNELLSLRINDIAPDHDPERFQRRLDTIKQGGAATYESRHRRKDGTEFPVEVSVTYLEHEGNGYTCGIIRDITERTRIERERHQALADLQNIMETVPDIMFTLDTAGNLIRWNSRLVVVTEYEPDSLLNKSALTFVPVEEQAQTAAAIQRAFTEGYAELDGHLRTKSGRIIPYHWTGATLKDAAGRIIGITGIGRDVSEQKQAQRELTQQRRHLLESQALAHLGSCEWEIASDTMVWSDEQFRIFGHAPQSIAVTHDTFLTALLPDDHDRVLAAMNEALLGKAPYDIECRIVRPTGEIRTIHCRGTIARDQSGHPVQMSGTVLDITERKRIDDALADSERRYRTIFETMPDPLFIVSFGGVVRDANPAACLTYGYTREEFTGLPVEKMIDPQSFRHLTAAIEAVEQGRSFQTECLDIRKDGSCFPVDVKISAFVSHGEPVMLSAVRDITDRKRMEEALRRSRTQLSDILENNPAVVYTRQVGDGWPHTFITPNIYQLLGHTSIDIIGRPELWDSLMHQEDLADLTTRGLPALLRTGSHTFITRLRHRDGSYRWIENQARLTHLDDGPLLMVGTMTDITVRMGAEQALRESEARNRSILESVLDAVISIDERGGIIGWNAQAEAMFGYSAQEVLGLPLDETIIPARYRQAHAHGMNRMLQKSNGSAVRRRFEFSALHRDGHEFPVEFAIASTQIGGRPTFSAFIRDITERKRAEEAVHASEERFRAAYHNASVGISICDLTGRLQEVNHALCEILGYSQQELLAKDFQSLTHPDDLPGNLDRIRGLMTGTVAHEVFEKRYVKKDGGTVWTQVGLSVIRSQDETPSHLLAMVQDITERKQAEEAVRKSEKRLRQAVLAGDIGIFDHDHQSDTIYWSPEQRRIYGWNAEEPVTLAKYLQHVYEEDREWIAESVRRAHDPAGDGRFDVEHRIVDRQGALHWLNTKSVTFFEGDGPARRKVRTVGAVADITERKQAEEARQKSEERFTFAIEATSDGIWDWNIQTGAVYFSPQWIRLLGYQPDDVPPSTEFFFSILHPEDVERTTQVLQAHLEGRIPVKELEVRLRQKSGEYRWYLDRGKVVARGRAGAPLRIVGTITDITERKQAEEALRASEERFRSLFENSPTAYQSLDLEGRFIDVNHKLCHLLGYARQELIGRSFEEFWADPVTCDFPRVFDAFRRSGEVRNELSLRRKDGSVVEVVIEGRIQRDRNGAFVRTHCILTDITERKRAEAVVTRSYDLMKSFVEHTPAAVAMLDNDLRYVAVSRRWLQDYRLGDQDLIGRHHYEIFPEIKDKQEWHAIHQRCLTGAVERREDDRFVRADGSEDWLRWEVRPWQDMTGRIGGIIMFTEVVTERKRAEKALRDTNYMLQALIETSPLAIIGLDQDGTNVTRWNPAAERIFGWRADEVLGHPLPYIPAEDQARSLAVWEETTQTGVLTGRELQRLRKDGSLIDMALWSTALKDAQGAVTGTFSFIADITDRKRTEEALKRSERQLRTVLDSLPIGVWFTDEKGYVLYGNPVGQRIWADAARVGLPQPESDGLWWESVDTTESLHRWAVGTVLARGRDVPNEMLEIETHGGDRRTIRNSAVPVKDDAGEIQGAIVLNEDITARVRAEQALRQEHALLMAVMDAATDIIFVKDIAGRYIHMNRAGARTLGMAVEDVIGWNEYALWPSDLAASCQLADRRVLDTGQPITVEETSVSDGTATIYLTTKAPYRDAEGRIIGIIGVARDITERKHAEEALRASEERFAKAFRSSPYPIVISEVESGLFIDANDAAFRSFGYQLEEVTNRTSTELHLWPTPDHRKRFVEHLQQAGAIRNLEIDLRMRNGELRHCLVSAELIELHGKRCMVTVGSDITEQKRAEQDLQRSHAFIRQIIDTDPNFIFAKDRDGRFILVNKAVAEAYGTTVDELIGKTDADFNNDAEEVAFFLRKDRDVMERLQDQFIPEERITDATGTIRWLQTVKRPILDESGHATMVLGASTDITERKQMEEALRQQERDLRAAIDERERISQDLHDGILQSLYAVGLGLEACKPLMTQRHYKKAVATMSEAIGQLNHVMSEVRNFIAGLESQVLQGSTFPAALQEMVNTLATTHPLRCTVSVDETAAGHISTQQALHLLNIVREALSNSLRHAQATKATVTLKPLSRCLRLSIVDNGVGFEPTGMRGVGHGLTNMAARARKVGGRFAIKSVPQRGTRITIDLPKENSYAESESAQHSTPARR